MPYNEKNNLVMNIFESALDSLTYFLYTALDFSMEYSFLIFSVFQLGSKNLLLISLFSLLYSFFVVFCFGNVIGDFGAGVFSISMTIFSLINVTSYIISAFWDFWIAYLYHLRGNFLITDQTNFDIPIVSFSFTKWLSCSEFDISWGFVFDPLSLSMMWVVLFITLMVQIYCLDYMYGDPFFAKFYSYLSIFAFFMLFLVVSDNYLQIFLGWEGVGLASFLLISFWTTRKAAVSAGMKAMFLNRFGDLFFIVALVILLKRFNSLNFSTIKILFASFESNIFDNEFRILGFALVLAAMAKSAQLGLHMWLPDAMEGPTPVSALIHAATMVTAGIFVLIRSSFFLIQIPEVLNFMIVLGSLTAVFGASTACVQFDIKKVIAYSTCSQLGYMMLSCGLGNFVGAFFHLVNHAFFKALLFLGSGSVIHAMSNEQDMRKMGSLSHFLPFTYMIMVFGSASLIGVPFFSGFYSKDNILEFGYTVNSSFSFFGFILGVVGAFCTAFYSFRLIYLVFLGPYNGKRSSVSTIHEPPFFMFFSLLILLVPSVTTGFLFRDLFLGQFGSIFWASSIDNFNLDFYVLPLWVQQAPTIFSVFGLIFAYLIYSFGYFSNMIHNQLFSFFYRFLVRKWYFDDLFSQLIRVFGFVIFKGFWCVFEKGFLNYIGPYGFSKLFQLLSKFINLILANISLVYLKFIIWFFFVIIFFMLTVVDPFGINFFEYFSIFFIFQLVLVLYHIFK